MRYTVGETNTCSILKRPHHQDDFMWTNQKCAMFCDVDGYGFWWSQFESDEWSLIWPTWTEIQVKETEIRNGGSEALEYWRTEDDSELGKIRNGKSESDYRWYFFHCKRLTQFCLGVWVCVPDWKYLILLPTNDASTCWLVFLLSSTTGQT